MLISERLTNFTTYLNGERRLGLVDIELPDLEPMTEEVSGSGILGTIETQTIGHFNAMTSTLKFRTISSDAFAFVPTERNQIVVRGSQQGMDSSRGTVKHEKVKITMNVQAKNTSLGKFEVGAQTDTSLEVNVHYFKMEVSGKVMAELDPLNHICIINGVDVMEEIRENLEI